MSPADLVIKEGRVALASSFRSCAVAVTQGKISWLGPNSSAPAAERTIDASGLIVLPGVIDVHVHMRDPGSTQKEDFRTGTGAAAAGGVTMVFDMPNNTPPTKDLTSLREKASEAERKAVVDYGLYGLVTAGNGGDLAPMADAGAIGFKCYMAETEGRLQRPPPEELREDMGVIARSGLRLAVHAEDGPTVEGLVRRLKAKGRLDALAHYESRPEAAESKAVREAISLSKAARCNLHVAHLSSSAGASLIRAAKRRVKHGTLTAETCPQYLLLDTSDYKEKGSLMKVNPAVKRKEDRVALWMAIDDDTIDMVATDHAPHTLEEKAAGPSIFEAAPGFPGLETSVALMLTCVNKGLLSLSKYVKLSSEGPARAWGLYPRKGAIAVGADADFTIVDAKKEWKIDASKFVSKAKYSPFDGFSVKGAAVYTVVRGRVVMDHGDVDFTSKGAMQKPGR